MTHDVVIVGGGHNALVAATLLAREGLDVVVLERLDHVGGAAISTRPWPHLAARLSRYSYLVSLFPTELISRLGLNLTLRSRPTASYTPYRHRDGTPDGLLVETKPGAATVEAFERLTGGTTEWLAWQQFYAEIEAFAAVVAPTLTGPLPSREQIRAATEPELWDDLVEQPLGTAIRRRFDHDLVRGIVATDALIGTHASLDDPSLVQNRCFLYHLIGNGTGEWRVPVGGMGAVSSALERAARSARADVRLGHHVDRLEPDVDGVDVHGTGPDGEPFGLRGRHVLFGAAPAVLNRVLGAEPGPPPIGSQFKVNLVLSRLPRLASGHDPREAFAGTFHLNESLTDLETLYTRSLTDAPAPFASGELYCHTLTDPSILGDELADRGAHTLTYFGLHTPYGTLPDDAAADRALDDMLRALQHHLDEPIEPLLLGIERKTPRMIEQDLAMPGGHIFHGDLQWPWWDEGSADHAAADEPQHRWGVSTPHPRIMLCGSGARRGGAVSGLAGLHAAEATLELCR